MDATTIVQILVGGGLLSAISETIRWWVGRGKTKVDSAQVVQGMAIDLLKPLHEELTRCNTEVARLRSQVGDLDRELELIISWALTAKGLLEAHNIEHPPMPEIRR
jgi:hypothetical protein